MFHLFLYKMSGTKITGGVMHIIKEQFETQTGIMTKAKKTMKIKKFDNKIPGYKTRKGDAGYDLFTTKTIWLFPFKISNVKLNIKCQLPKETFGFITSRSGLGSNGIVVVNGIIDEIYRGYLNASVYSLKFLPRIIKKGTKIAQMVIIPYEELEVITVTSDDELTKTIRGTDHFGSTGNN
ncbi:MAG: hypothetical protein B6I28_03700 [Fusobacteriia bacterium 4572_132]|nr:MAG: hypothetical protein B6I28_03700 [Fusobacteriia bacterium 4572_132]